jgi:excisionase family DNA binding protein
MNKTVEAFANILIDKVLELLGKRSLMLFDNQKWMNTKEAAEYLRISENNLRVKISRGEIPVHGRLGRNWRFRRDRLDELLNSPERGVFND